MKSTSLVAWLTATLALVALGTAACNEPPKTEAPSRVKRSTSRAYCLEPARRGNASTNWPGSNRARNLSKQGTTY